MATWREVTADWTFDRQLLLCAHFIESLTGHRPAAPGAEAYIGDYYGAAAMLIHEILHLVSTQANCKPCPSMLSFQEVTSSG